VVSGRRELTVIYRRRTAGGWSASVRELRGCRSRGRTIREARQALRAALAPHVEDPHAVDLLEDVRLPGAARRLVVRHWSAMKRAEREVTKARAVAQEAVAALRRLRLSAGDARDLLGLSTPKLKQLLR
jgi:predicted RNase H-like HicB family nuclease